MCRHVGNRRACAVRWTGAGRENARRRGQGGGTKENGADLWKEMRAGTDEMKYGCRDQMGDGKTIMLVSR